MITKEKLQREILSARRGQYFNASKAHWGIMVLSAKPATNSFGRLITEWTDENLNRIRLGYAMIVGYINAGTEFTPDNGPWLILNGERNQLPMMTTAALELGVPAEQLMLVDCGVRPDGNTKTQFAVLQNDRRFLGSQKDILAVTSWYHLALVARIIPKQAPKNIRWSLAAENDKSNFKQAKKSQQIKVCSEAEKILHYIECGDAIEKPPRYLVGDPLC